MRGVRVRRCLKFRQTILEEAESRLDVLDGEANLRPADCQNRRDQAAFGVPFFVFGKEKQKGI